MHKRLDIQEVKTKAQVDKAYEEYQEFIKVSEMPKYKFKYVNQKGTTIAEERYENDTYYLIVANTLCTADYKAAAKGILFHEFTHILDEEELSQMLYIGRSIYYISHINRHIIHRGNEQIKTR